ETGDLTFDGQTSDQIADTLWERVVHHYEDKEQVVGREVLQRVERDIMLQIVDSQWKDHLYSLDHLKEGIGLRGYGQRDPLVEYKKESFDLFQDMKGRIDEEIVRYLWWLRPVITEEEPVVRRPRRPAQITMNKAEAVPAFAGVAAGGGSGDGGGAATPAAAASRQPPRVGGDDAKVHTVRRDAPKVGRNDPCPCGSGKKYKKCHGAGVA
ncbi:MAG: SEC-C domain-containing protein, partial [Acidobacteriota bacterium]|nr:SEC-C domain-containing protein [Acidobacteriota bacterium]